MIKRVYKLLFAAMILTMAVSPAVLAAPNPNAPVNDCKQMLQEYSKNGQMTREQVEACKKHLTDIRKYKNMPELVCPLTME